jgi:type IV secretory pathway VirB10-like protein
MAEAPFIDSVREPEVTTLRLGRVLVLVGVVVGVLVGAGVWYVRAKQPSRAPTSAATETSAWPAWMRKRPTYAPPPAAAPAVPPPGGRPQQAGVGSGLPMGPQPPTAIPEPTYEPEGTGGTPASAQPRRDPPPVRKWLFAKMGAPARRPFQAETGPGEGPAPAPAPKSTTLIQQARWEDPADPRHVLYPSMVIPVQILHDISSDLPGEIRLLVMQDVQDKHFQGTMLLPQYSYIIGHQAGTPTYGQPVITMEVRAVEFPSGRMLDLTTAVVQDSRGQAGLRGKVDYHYVQLGIAAVLSAVMSAGSRAVVNNRGTYRPTLEEEFATDISRSLNQSGQAIVKRELDRPPTVTVRHGTLATLQLRQAVSLQTNPVIVDK